MRTSAHTIRRQVAVLQLRAKGLTQAEVARELGLHQQSVARIERRFRRGWLRLPAGPLLDALNAEYHQARTESARAHLLSSLVALVTEQSRLRRAELALEQLRAVHAEPEPDEPLDLARTEPVRAPRKIRRTRRGPPLTGAGRAWLDEVFSTVGRNASAE